MNQFNHWLNSTWHQKKYEWHYTTQRSWLGRLWGIRQGDYEISFREYFWQTEYLILRKSGPWQILIWFNPNKRGMPAATKWGACWRFFSNWNGTVGENSPMPRLIVGAGRWSYRNFETSPKTVLETGTFSYLITNTKLLRFHSFNWTLTKSFRSFYRFLPKTPQKMWNFVTYMK